MINPTLAQAHLNKGEPAMVQPTPMVGNLMDAGTASKVALNPQQQISAQQLTTKIGQDAHTAVIGQRAMEEGAMRTAQLKDSQAQQDAAQAVSTMIYATYGPNSATASFANPDALASRTNSVIEQLAIRGKMA
tara:strand:- start:107 stop:505 length:399 start_codon:yes stop_codon:yes gene_type:complete